MMIVWSKLNVFKVIMILILFIGNSSCQGSDEAIESNALENTVISGDTNSSKEPGTNVIVKKIVDGTEGYPNLIYKIKIPKVDYFDFVLALDSSGSFGYGQEYSEAHAVAGAVPLFIRDIVDKNSYNKNINLSIISFDDEIDFAYNGSKELDPFKNRDIKLAKLINVTEVNSDIENNPDVFGENTEAFHYYANESEFTNLSVPIKYSIDILDSVKQDRLHRISKFMILVTGKGEFTNCTEELIQKAIERNYSIYVIGMDLIEEDNDAQKLKAQLKSLSQFEKYRWTRLQYVPLGSKPEELRDELLDALKDALQNAINAPAARNVRIVESFYPYINPIPNAITVNGTDGMIKNLNYDLMNNSISFELDKDLSPESETTITVPAELHLSGLPISITNASLPFSIGTISKNTPTSTISYLWFDGYQGLIPLTENELNLDISSKNKKILGSENPVQAGFFFDFDIISKVLGG